MRVLVAEVVRERRREGATDEVGAGEPLDDPARRVEGPVARLGGEEVLRVGREPRRPDDVALRRAGHVGLDDDVVDVGAHHDAEVGRQGPGRRRPHERELAGLEPEPDGDGGVLTHLVDVVVHPQLVVRQRRLVVPAVGQDAEALVDEALVPQLLERPHDALHVLRVERLVVVLEVDPARLAGDVLLPLVGVLQHRRAAGVVEGLDAELEDLVLGLDAELAHRLELGGKAVGVPAEAALHPAPAHRLVARDDVLDVAGEQVSVVRQAVGEGRSVVEDELVGAVDAGLAVLHRRDEGAVLVPVPQHPLLDRGEPRARLDAGGRPVGRGGLGGRLGIGGRGHGRLLQSARHSVGRS